jgi:hypothetical protein
VHIYTEGKNVTTNVDLEITLTDGPAGDWSPPSIQHAASTGGSLAGDKYSSNGSRTIAILCRFISSESENTRQGQVLGPTKECSAGLIVRIREIQNSNHSSKQEPIVYNLGIISPSKQGLSQYPT